MTRDTVQTKERGAVLVEAAFILPIFIYLLFGIIGFGADFGLSQSVTHSVSEAAREAIAAPSQSPGETNCLAWTNSIDNTVKNGLSWLPSTAPAPTITFYDASGLTTDQCPTTSSTASGTTYVKVTETAPTVLPNLPGWGALAPNSISASARVEVQ